MCKYYSWYLVRNLIGLAVLSWWHGEIKYLYSGCQLKIKSNAVLLTCTMKEAYGIITWK